MFVSLQHPSELEQMCLLQGCQRQHPLQAGMWQQQLIPAPQHLLGQQHLLPEQQVIKLQELLHFGRQQDEVPTTGDLSLENVEDVNEVLSLACSKLPLLSSQQLVSCIHSVGKLVDGDEGASTELVNDARLNAVLKVLREKAHECTAPRSMMRVTWALGKLGLKGPDVEGIISTFLLLAPPRLPQFSPQELSNMLWGLARANGSAQMRIHDATALAQQVMREGTKRLKGFGTQCLTNSLWSVAKLGLKGQDVSAFARECVLEIHFVMFKEMSPQGLANSLWACAKIQCESREPVLDVEIVANFCMDAARRAMAGEDLLKLFFPQELSMALWGIAKLMGRRNRSHVDSDIERFAIAVAAEASWRIEEFSAQGVSIVAWALATLNFTEGAEVCEFFECAAEVAGKNIQNYPPQAIANLCWALNRVPGKPEVLACFGRAAALQAQKRFKDFSWQDSSGIVSALMNLGGGTKEVRDLTILLVKMASHQSRQIGTQALLNIALSAVRQRLEVEVLLPLAHSITETFAMRQGLNEIDLRQWQEVQRYCGLSAPAPGRKKKKKKPGNETASVRDAHASRGYGGKPPDNNSS